MCSLVNTDDAGNVSVVLMMKLPTGEMVPCTVPAVVILPSLSPAITTFTPSQSTASIVSKPMQLISDGSLMSSVVGGSQVQTQSLLPLNCHAQAPLGLPGVVLSMAVTVSDTQPGTTFDVQESGLTALGIAASTREVGTDVDKST